MRKIIILVIGLATLIACNNKQEPEVMPAEKWVKSWNYNDGFIGYGRVDSGRVRIRVSQDVYSSKYIKNTIGRLENIKKIDSTHYTADYVYEQKRGSQKVMQIVYDITQKIEIHNDRIILLESVTIKQQ